MSLWYTVSCFTYLQRKRVLKWSWGVCLGCMQYDHLLLTSVSWVTVSKVNFGQTKANPLKPVTFPATASSLYSSLTASVVMLSWFHPSHASTDAARAQNPKDAAWAGMMLWLAWYAMNDQRNHQLKWSAKLTIPPPHHPMVVSLSSCQTDSSSVNILSCITVLGARSPRCCLHLHLIDHLNDWCVCDSYICYICLDTLYIKSTRIAVLQQNISRCYIYKNIQHLLHYIDFL